MKLGKIIEELEKAYPLSVQASWDNSGLQAGDREKEVKRIFLALDATEENIGQAREWKADLLLTHHPLIFGGIKKVTADELTGRKVLELIRADICQYAMHTNFDVVTMASLCAGILGLREQEVLETLFVDEEGREQGFGRVGLLERPMTLRELAKEVKEKFELDTVKVFGRLDTVVEKAAVLPGSGKSEVKAALAKGAEVFISGDFGHHDGIDAVDDGLMILDAGHYGLEHVFINYMEEFCREHFPEIEVGTAKLQNPFEVV